MPAQNKRQNVANMSGSGSLDSPYEKNLISGIPDITFSDTSQPVFFPKTTVYGSWNIPITGVSPDDLIFSWYVARGFSGKITLVLDESNQNPPITKTNFEIEFVKNSRGSVVIGLKENAALNALDNRTYGPPADRSFEVVFDNTIQSIGDINPAGLFLNAPSSSAGWTQPIWRQKFTWTKRVNGFTKEDIKFKVDDATAPDIAGKLIQDPDDDRIYYMDIGLAGSGKITISVDAEVAKSGDAPSPPKPVETSWNYNVQTKSLRPSGVDAVILSETFDIGVNPYVEGGGLFMGVSDMFVLGEGSDEKVYFVDQIARRSGQEIDTLHPSAGALCSVPTGNTPTNAVNIEDINKTTCKKYNYFTQAARSLCEHNQELHFFEGSAYHFNNETLLSTGAVIPVDEMGFVRKINSAGKIITLGLNFQSKFPTGPSDRYVGRHMGTFSPMISHDGDLHIISQRKDFFAINGVQWIVYSNKLNQRITLLETNGKNGFEVIESLANLTNSIMGYENGTFVFRPRLQTTAKLVIIEGKLLTLKDPNRVANALGFIDVISYWKASGDILIGEEIISYENFSYDSMSKTYTMDITSRGAYDTDIKDTHDPNSEITHIEKVINAMDMARPVNDMDIETDGTFIYNHIIAKYAENQVPRTNFLSFATTDKIDKDTGEVVKDSSIDLYGEREIDLELPLDYHQKDWAALLTNQFLQEYKSIRISIRLTLKRDLDISLGDIIYLNEPVIERQGWLCRVMSVVQHKKREETEVIVILVNNT